MKYSEERGCEHCAYYFHQFPKEDPRRDIVHCFATGISFKEGMIVDCDNWKTSDISKQLEEYINGSPLKTIKNFWVRKENNNEHT